jgi:small-conductance mechanosensitive channel
MLVLLSTLAGSLAIAQDAPLETPISAESNSTRDAQIARRLSNIYSNLTELKGLEVEVDEGIVTLSGEIYTREAEVRALELASRTEGVVSVQNELQYNQAILPKLSIVGNQLALRGRAVVQFLPVLLVALAVFAGFWYLARWLTQGRAYFDRIAPNVFIGDLIRQLVRIGVTLLGLIIALEIADATSILGSVLGALGLAGLAIGFAIRDTVENYIASILLSLRQPFSPDDHVLIEGQEGLVLRLTSRATVLMSFDGNHIRIPNSMVYKGMIVNYSRNPRRRFTFDVGVGTDVNLVDALQLASDTMQRTRGVLASPAPVGLVDSLGDSNVVLRFYAWMDQRDSNYSTVRSETIRRVKAKFEQADFDMPEPIYRLYVQSEQGTAGSGTAARQAVAPASLEHAEGVGESPEAAVRAQLEADDSDEDANANLLSGDAPKE